MNVSRLLLPLLLLSLTASAAPPASPSPDSKAVAKEPLTFYLDSETKALGSYYTIEYYEPSGASPSLLGAAQIEPKPVPTLAQLVMYLKAQIPKAQVFTDLANPKVIHVIDNRLLFQKDYGLNAFVDMSYDGLLSGLGNPFFDMSYDGALSGLPKLIGTLTGDSLWYSNSISSVVSSYADDQNVSVRLKNTSGREVLTSAAYLPGCNHELWQASSGPLDGGITTSVYFPWPSH